MKREEYTVTLRELVFNLLSKNERTVVHQLDIADHPLSLNELRCQVLISYRTLKRIVKRLETKKVVVCYRDVIKVVALNSILMEEKE